MEIRNLESFIQVAELGSFTKAAESLGYTQSSVSTQIRQLEKELGIPLFERINHRVRLTEKGKEILNLTHELFRTAEAIKKTADNPLTLSGHIRIATAPSLCHWLFQNNFEQFHRHFPDISLEVISTSTEEMFRLLSQNEIDLVYTLDHHIYDRNYVIAYEAPVSCHFFCSSAHPLASRESVPVKQLIHESFILTERNTSYQKLLDQHLTSLSLEIDSFSGAQRYQPDHTDAAKRVGGLFSAGLCGGNSYSGKKTRPYSRAGSEYRNLETDPLPQKQVDFAGNTGGY